LYVSAWAGATAINGSAVAANSANDKVIERKGPLAGLPSKPGPHVDKIRALGDNEWLNLGSPAPDPKWGRALGRSWTPKMPYAPDLRGAFLTGEGNHGWVNPKTNRQMDDYWFYDINAHRWICIYPGTEVSTLDTKFIFNKDGFTAHQDGELIPVSLHAHAYECLTYDTHLKRFVCMSQAQGLYGPAHKLARKSKAEGSPWYFDTVTGKWGRQALKGPYPIHATMGDVLMYVPSKKQVFYHAFGSGRNNTYFYDPASNLWTEVKTQWTDNFNMNSEPQPGQGDVSACYDSKRDRIYMGRINRL
jgi:hypothetical protein